MELQPIYLRIGKWQTPKHSERGRDDTHEIKGQILKDIGRQEFEGKVGKNPNIHVDKEGRIVLRGVGSNKGKEHVTDLPAESFFVEVSLVPFSEPSIASPTHFFIVPPDSRIINRLLRLQIPQLRARDRLLIVVAS